MSQEDSTGPGGEDLNMESSSSESMGESQDLSDGMRLDDSQEVTEDSIDQAAQNGQLTQKQAQTLKKTLKIKVDGKEMEETIDFNDEDALKRYIQKSKAFDTRNQEFVQYKSQMEELVNLFKQDPGLVMEKLGLDADKFSEDRLAKKVAEMKKSPEQLAREKMEKELEDLRSEKKRAEDEKAVEAQERLKNQYAMEIENDIDQALADSKSMLPKKNPLVIQRIASTMLSAIDKGFTDVTAKDVIPVVEKQWKQELNEFFKILPDDVFEALATKERLDNYRKNKITSTNAAKKAVTTTARQLTTDTGASKKVQDDPYETRSKSTAGFKKMFNNHDN